MDVGYAFRRQPGWRQARAEGAALRVRTAAPQQAQPAAQQQARCPFGGLASLVTPRPGLGPAFDLIDHKPYLQKRKQGPYKMMMGLEPMAWDDWIEVDDEYLADMAERRELIAHKRQQVIRSTHLAGSANRELLDLLVAYLPQRFPGHFQLDGGRLTNAATGDVWDLADDSADPLDVAAQLVQEDLILLQKDADNQLRFVSGAVLFPQRWALAEKIGHELDSIHGPVPQYQQSISRPVNAFMERVSSQRPFWRSNWTVCAYPEKFAPLLEEGKVQLNQRAVPIAKEPITAENAGQRLWTRVERQAVFRLPKSGAILFSVHTFVKPLHRLEARPEEAEQLAAAVRALPADIQLYKSIALIREPLLQYLDCVSQQRRSSQKTQLVSDGGQHADCRLRGNFCLFTMRIPLPVSSVITSTPSQLAVRHVQ